MGELEVYVLADRCVGLPAGAWHYESHAHALHPMPTDGGLREMLLLNAQNSLAADSRPQILLIVTARHERLLWKYSSIGYALELKDLGVLFECWYLLAAALGIGACAIGTGDADLFARLSALPYNQESSIGEFAIGSITQNPVFFRKEDLTS